MEPVFGVPPNQPAAGVGVAAGGGFNAGAGFGYTGQQGGYYGAGPMTHSPWGHVAAVKGDLIYPLFTVGFFILGVVVVVKVLLWILSLFKAKLLYSFVPRSADEIFDRKRRSADSPVDQSKLDGLTSVIMAALETQECQQRMMCELGTLIQQYDSSNLVLGLAERMAPDTFSTQMKAFASANQCNRYRCGRLTSGDSKAEETNADSTEQHTDDS